MTATTALQHLVRFCNGSDYKSVESADGPYPVYGSGGEFARSSDFLYEGESVLFGRKGTVDRPLYVNGRFWTVDTMYYTDSGSRVEPRFLYYWATTIPFDLYSTNTALPSMTSGALGRLQFPLLERERQRRIADYLDRETAKLDTLIEKQQALVSGLRQRRTAMIVSATTGRLAEGARKPSASSWLDEMPTRWSESPLKSLLANVQTGFWGAEESGGGSDVRVVRVADFDRSTLSVGTAPTVRSVSPLERVKASLQRGDLLMEKSGGTGRNPVGFVVSYESDEESIYANFIVRLRLKHGQYQRYWLYALHGSYASGLTWKGADAGIGDN